MFDEATLSRRVLLKRVAGTATALALPSAFVACGNDDTQSDSGGGGGGSGAKESVGTVTFGSNASDPVPKAAYEKVFAGVQDRHRRRRQGQHRRPQHLPGADQQLPAGQAGRRVHLVRRLPDAVLRAARAWRPTSPTSGATSAPTTPTRSRTRRRALDGKQYFVPFYNYPWAVFYRKSVFEKNGYTVPKTLDELKTLADADEEGRPRRRSPSPTRTAGRRWAPSTSSTCASTATTSTCR